MNNGSDPRPILSLSHHIEQNSLFTALIHVPIRCSRSGRDGVKYKSGDLNLPILGLASRDVP
jgi:hypothetical protein